jgi:hypothetical protein
MILLFPQLPPKPCDRVLTCVANNLLHLVDVRHVRGNTISMTKITPAAMKEMLDELEQTRQSTKGTRHRVVVFSEGMRIRE